ncbi:MAG: hypothetical protein JNM94_14160 [Phycisphaerae bacterium]|nr:hypothetical protein [Phycisphaerae bacterium]
MATDGRPSDATSLLTRAVTVARTGTEAERAAADAELLSAVYGELRAIAGSYFRGQAASHTLQPTALVHEAWVRLAGHASLSDPDRAHFRAVASTAMRNILVDHARAKRAAKRGGNVERVTIDTAVDPEATAGNVEIGPQTRPTSWRSTTRSARSPNAIRDRRASSRCASSAG